MLKKFLISFKLNYFLFYFFVVSIFFGCKNEFPNENISNIKPNAYLWIFPSYDSISQGISRQNIHWWGEDADGFVVGFLIGIGKNENEINWSFKTKNDSTIFFPLLISQDTFAVFVKAIDNNFSESRVDGETIFLQNGNYYKDANHNNVFDSLDIFLSTMNGSIGKTISQKFPLKNSVPSVSFLTDETNSTINPPETTFTVITFSWKGADLDGDNTIANYEIALNDSTQWTQLPKSATTITLNVPRSISDNVNDVVEANIDTGTYGRMRQIATAPNLKLDSKNKLYLRVRDVAGDVSKIVSLPDSTSFWYVKKPKSKLLVVEDYISTSGINHPDSVIKFYRNIFNQSQLDEKIKNFDFLSTRRNEGKFLPQTLNPTFILTLQLFDYVFWYSGQEASWTIAANPLFLYAVDPATSGRILFSTAFQYSLSDPRGSLVNFAPIEAVSVSDDSTITRAYADTTISSIVDSFPQLSFRNSPNIHSQFFFRHLYKRNSGTAIYQIDSIKSKTGKKISPTVGIIDANNRFVFIGVPLHLVNGNGNLPLFFEKIFNDIFTR